MNPSEPRKRGGQPKPPGARKNRSLTIRVLDELWQRLEAEAEKSGRSMSEEAAYRMLVGFLLGNELKAFSEIQKDLAKNADDSIKAAMHRRGWGKVITKTGTKTTTVFIPPGEHTLPRSGFVDAAEIAAIEVEKAIATQLTPSLEKAVGETVEKAVASALAGATLRIGGGRK
jgi:hypothetical protein